MGTSVRQRWREDGIQQPLKSRAVLAREVRSEAGVNPKEHLRRGVAQLPGNPFRTFAARQPQGRRGVTRLVGTTLPQVKMPQQRVPDAVGEVVVIEGFAVPI